MVAIGAWSLFVMTPMLCEGTAVYPGVVVTGKELQRHGWISYPEGPAGALPGNFQGSSELMLSHDRALCVGPWTFKEWLC